MWWIIGLAAAWFGYEFYKSKSPAAFPGWSHYTRGPIVYYVRDSNGDWFSSDLQTGMLISGSSNHPNPAPAPI